MGQMGVMMWDVYLDDAEAACVGGRFKVRQRVPLWVQLEPAMLV